MLCQYDDFPILDTDFDEDAFVEFFCEDTSNLTFYPEEEAMNGI